MWWPERTQANLLQSIRCKSADHSTGICDTVGRICCHLVSNVGVLIPAPPTTAFWPLSSCYTMAHKYLLKNWVSVCMQLWVLPVPAVMNPHLGKQCLLFEYEVALGIKHDGNLKNLRLLRPSHNPKKWGDLLPLNNAIRIDLILEAFPPSLLTPVPTTYPWSACRVVVLQVSRNCCVLFLKNVSLSWLVPGHGNGQVDTRRTVTSSVWQWRRGSAKCLRVLLTEEPC